MAIYAYKAIARGSGKKTKGVIDADTAGQARRKLREMELFPTELAETTAANAVAGDGKAGVSKRSIRGRVSTRDLAMMTRQFATLLKAGMAMVETLGALIEQTENAKLKATIFDVRDRVNAGKSLGEAMEEHPRVFSNLYTNMVKAGEISGALEGVLFRLSEILERQSKLKSQILSSMAYPAFMAVFAVGVITFLMVVIVPRITALFAKQDMDLPGITKALMAFSEFIGSIYGVFIVVGVIGSILLWRMWISTGKGRRRWDRMKIHFPLYGKLHLKMVCARFSRTLGTMLQSGLTMLPALDVVVSVIGNRFIEETMDDVKAGVRRGRDLAQPLRDTALFPPMMLHMVELGQRSGELDAMLLHVAETYDDDVKLTVDAVVSLLEPIIIIIMGIFVGFLVLAILLPILKISTSVGG